MITIKNTGHIFSPGTPNATIALRDVNLQLNKGDFVVVLGANGSGKSTLLNAIAGVIIPDQGQVIIDGNDVSDLKDFQRSKWIARVFQDPLAGTAADLSILDNLRLASIRTQSKKLRFGINDKFKNEVADAVSVLQLGLENKLNQPVGTLSGGQRQALTLLMAVMDNASVLLMDEPTAALDPATAARIMQLADDLVKKHNLTTMLVTHSLKDAVKYGNRIILMKEGAVYKEWDKTTCKEVTVEELIAYYE
ncbi:MAG: ATP-binding cassette domain-containing protein [Bacteroidia bacterium]|nr:ATP-binding cassette domain-containing protein [Bacteroidia bacterium]